MAVLVESQIADALTALRTFDRAGADRVRSNDQAVNQLLHDIREQALQLIATQQPVVACDLRTVMGVQLVAIELERMGDYVVRIARRTSTLAGLSQRSLPQELELMGTLASRQVRDILAALVAQDAEQARVVAGRDREVDDLYDTLFEDLIEASTRQDGPEAPLRTVTLINLAHSLERLGDRVVNIAEDILFLQSGQVVELDEQVGSIYPMPRSGPSG
jgi:phosphate transport system protein